MEGDGKDLSSALVRLGDPARSSKNKWSDLAQALSCMMTNRNVLKEEMHEHFSILNEKNEIAAKEAKVERDALREQFLRGQKEKEKMQKQLDILSRKIESLEQKSFIPVVENAMSKISADEDSSKAGEIEEKIVKINGAAIHHSHSQVMLCSTKQ